MNDQLLSALEQIEDEKGISRDELLGMIETALAAAFRKDYGEKNQNPVVKFDPENMGVKVHDVKTVVATAEEAAEDPQKLIDVETAQEIKKKAQVGDEIKTDITPKSGTNFGRIAAQTAKQVIIQKLREAERNMQFSDFKSKERTFHHLFLFRLIKIFYLL
jgi:N utilization substance protein A